MNKNKGFEKLGDLFGKGNPKKPTAYSWQDLALRVISELKIPPFKKSSVFKICKNNPQVVVLKAMNDTKELCKSGEKWKYFFKIIDSDRKGLFGS